MLHAPQYQHRHISQLPHKVQFRILASEWYSALTPQLQNYWRQITKPYLTQEEFLTSFTGVVDAFVCMLSITASGVQETEFYEMSLMSCSTSITNQD